MTDGKGLKRCPFCGNTDIHGSWLGTWFIVKCYKCSASVQFRDVHEAISVWNTRPKSDLLKLKEYCEKQRRCPCDISCYMHGALMPNEWNIPEILKVLEKEPSNDR